MNQEKMAQYRTNTVIKKKLVSFLQSIISLVPKGVHKIHGSQILGTLLIVKPHNWSKKISKVPLFSNFHNFMFLNDKFWHFLNWQKFLI